MWYIIGLVIIFILALVEALCKLNSQISREEEQEELKRAIEKRNKENEISKENVNV